MKTFIENIKCENCIVGVEEAYSNARIILTKEFGRNEYADVWKVYFKFCPECAMKIEMKTFEK